MVDESLVLTLDTGHLAGLEGVSMFSVDFAVECFLPVRLHN
jgi:hypothetical protein